MHQTSDTLYFKEYNLVIKYGLPLKAGIDRLHWCMHTQNNHAMHIFQQVISTGLTPNMYISTLAMCWFQQTMSTNILYLKKLFCKNCKIFKKTFESKMFFRLTQATNTYKHISRNIGATMIASRKLVFFNFSQKKICITIKKCYGWHNAFAIIYSYCLFMWVYIDIIFCAFLYTVTIASTRALQRPR